MSKKKSAAKKVEKSQKIPSGWDTTDEEEIKRRRLRAESENMIVYNLDSSEFYFGKYKVKSSSGQEYIIEIRSLQENINSCTCADYNTNGLGTCKHIEKVLLALEKKGKRKFQKISQTGSSKVEIYINPANNKVTVQWNSHKLSNSAIYLLLKDFFSVDNNLIAEIENSIPVITNHIKNSSELIQQQVRISERIQLFLDERNSCLQNERVKDVFLQNVANGKSTLDILKLPLYDYQKKGMMHLAFKKRAILADEMGLGKTVQAIAACELLKRLHGIQKVLVVSPTSLKTEWEEQIKKFTDLPLIIIYGNRANRLKQYQSDTFFYLTNYEQILRDHDTIQRVIAPEVIILDEAQRIKNWRTKTASAIKKLNSEYAFVLTGTPVENRIDDIYSIMQFLDSKFFGALFRFNRQFYRLDDKGKAIGYKNLDKLHKKLQPILLRRLKCDVEGQLPVKTVNNYFVVMSKEQNDRYIDYEYIVARLARIARKRPLMKEEFERLQLALASMRMLCDTPYILDDKCRVCPKLHELENLLEELLQDKDTKIIIFSEWVKMLHLVQELLKNMGKRYALHTGEIDQKRRRSEINYFKNDDDCKIFLSTDSGSVGLNLQVANVVINLDLPWNPAKLEQRIARAWRKRQTKTVQVINLISESTIEHRMLAVLQMKQSLADSILDLGDTANIDIPSGRNALIERLNEITGDAFIKSKSPNENNEINQITTFQQEIIARYKLRLCRLESYKKDNGHETTLVVMDGDIQETREQIIESYNKLEQRELIDIEVIDRITYESMKRLSENGIISFNQTDNTVLYPPKMNSVSNYDEEKKRYDKAKKCLDQTSRKQKMVSLLMSNEFYDEAVPPISEIFELSLKSLAIYLNYEKANNDNISIKFIKTKLISELNLPEHIVDLAEKLRDKNYDEIGDKNIVKNLFNSVQQVNNMTNKILDKFIVEYDVV